MITAPTSKRTAHTPSPSAADAVGPLLDALAPNVAVRVEPSPRRDACRSIAMTGAAEGERPCTAPDDSRRPPRPAHGFVTEWCIDEDVPVTSEPAAVAPGSRP